jgi:hypothetical protein
MRRYWVLVPLLLAAAPASAQIWGGTSFAPPSGPNLPRAPIAVAATGSGETGKIRRDIHDGRDSGQLSRRDARRLRREASQIDAMEARFGRDGFSDAELYELAARRQLLREDVIAKRSGQRN